MHQWFLVKIVFHTKKGLIFYVQDPWIKRMPLKIQNKGMSSLFYGRTTTEWETTDTYMYHLLMAWSPMKVFSVFLMKVFISIANEVFICIPKLFLYS